jgi:hypothetical protein
MLAALLDEEAGESEVYDRRGHMFPGDQAQEGNPAGFQLRAFSAPTLAGILYTTQKILTCYMLRTNVTRARVA